MGVGVRGCVGAWVRGRMGAWDKHADVRDAGLTGVAGSAEKWPSAHSVHSDTPVSQKVPAGHGSQLALPESFWYFPAAHTYPRAGARAIVCMRVCACECAGAGVQLVCERVCACAACVSVIVRMRASRGRASAGASVGA